MVRSGNADLTGSYSLAQSRCFRHRLHAQFICQNPATGFILGQGRVALAAVGQQQHQVAMGRFSQRVKL